MDSRPDNTPEPADPTRLTELGTFSGATAPAPTRNIPEHFGRYRILRLLAEGGMGSVYEAEQESPHRTVALKVIKPGHADEEMIRRFEQESQALGRLQHPGIAQIYEAGRAETPSGAQPFIAMEFVQGIPLAAYAVQHNLSMRQRLELVQKVCDAVHHAHQRGLIHRDLKPGNILVDGNGQPKVLDFGIAQMADQQAEMTRQTNVGQLIGTLPYMSPEQVVGDPYEIDTRTDVYALGVILYELLAERLPYVLAKKPLHEALQVIREQEPTRLSSVNRTCRGDIETIVQKALEKDKSRRYASAAGLAGDIRRYLNDEPITAHPPSAMYQARKFARRYRTAVAGVAAVFVVLVAGVIASSVESVRAKRAEVTARQAESQAESQRDRAVTAEKTASEERDRAVTAEKAATESRDRALKAEAISKQERDLALAAQKRADNEAATAKAIDEFLRNDLLRQASAVGQDAGAEADPDIKVRTVLDRAAGRVAGRFTGKPQVEASIEDTIGQTYFDLGLYAQAKNHLQRALQLNQSALGSDNVATLGVAEKLGETYRSAGDLAKAEALLKETVARSVKTRGQDDPMTLKAMGILGDVLIMESKLGEAETLLNDVLERDKRVLGPYHETTLDNMGILARVYFMQGKLPETEQMLLATIDGQKRTFGPDHPYTLTTMNNLAVVYQRDSKFDEAEKLYQQVIASQKKVNGPEHPETLNSMGNLGVLYSVEGKYPQAAAQDSQVLEILRKQLGPEHPTVMSVMSNLAVVNLGEHNYAEAERLEKTVLEMRTKVLGPEHVDTLDSMKILGAVYEAQGKYSEAEPLLTKALELRRKVSGPKHPETLDLMNKVGELRVDQGRFAEAETVLKEALEIQKQSQSYRRFWTEALLGASLAGQKRYTEAETDLLAGYEGMKQKAMTVPELNRQSMRKAQGFVAKMYADSGSSEKAAEWTSRVQ